MRRRFGKMVGSLSKVKLDIQNGRKAYTGIMEYEESFSKGMQALHELLLEPLSHHLHDLEHVQSKCGGCMNNDGPFTLFVQLFEPFRLAASHLATKGLQAWEQLGHEHHADVEDCGVDLMGKHMQKVSTHRWHLEPFMNRAMIIATLLAYQVDSIPNSNFKTTLLEQTAALRNFDRKVNSYSVP